MKFMLNKFAYGAEKEYSTDAFGEVRDFFSVDIKSAEELVDLMKDNDAHSITIYPESVIFPQYPEIMLNGEYDDYSC